MQPGQPRWRQSWPRRLWRRRNWISYVKLALVLTFSISIIFFGRHHGDRWRTERPEDPFPPTVAGVAKAIDGDSLWVGGKEVRLKGIDAPELTQTCERDGAPWNCGEYARAALIRAIGNDSVTCAISDRDVYGRMLGRCAAAGKDLNAQMVSSGMATAYGGYWNEQTRARSEKGGIWAGEFKEPRDWRTEHASEETR
jgi:endonuclease YncB( thermonuclease family)